MGFKITRNKGFHIDLPNGWTVSVQFGAGNYSSNRNAEFDAEKNADVWKSKTAEIACFPTEKGGEWYSFGDDEVKGWVTSTEFMEWLEVFKELPSPGEVGT